MKDLINATVWLIRDVLGILAGAAIVVAVGALYAFGVVLPLSSAITWVLEKLFG